MSFLLALDQGTTSSRAIVFDTEGMIQGMGQREFPQHYPHPGWVEHDPMDLWSSQAGVISEALAQARIGPDQLAAVGIANQRETTLIWERATGTPVGPAIVWQDRRTAELCEQLRARGVEPLFTQRTGLCLDPYFSGTKLAWMLEHHPGLRARAERGELAFGTVDSWLVWQLTQGQRHVTDPSNASRTLLFNLRTGDWDDDLLGILNIPRPLLPDLVPSQGVIGEVSHPLGPVGRPIAAILGDQQAALAGQVCFYPGMSKCTYGTGCFVLMNLGDDPRPSRHRLLTTAAWCLGAERSLVYALEGAVFIGGAVVQWLRDGLGLIRSSAEVEALATSVPDSGGVYFVPAFVGLGVPDWDPHASGTLIGIGRGTNAAHLARAALESIAFQVAEALHAMRADIEGSGFDLGELRVDGGASVNRTLMQFQADLLGVAVVRPAVTETTALGAALFAGLGAGLWRDETELEGVWRAAERFEPRLAPSQAQARLARWREAVERSKGWRHD